MVEELFFEYAKENKIVVQSSCACIKFTVNLVQQMDQNVAKLMENVLYHLKINFYYTNCFVIA